MELFKDKTYDELDEISQLVEPYVFPVNEDLAKCEDEIILSEDIMYNIVFFGHSVSNRRLIKMYAEKNGLTNLDRHASNNYTFADDFFKLEISPNATFNAATGELNGEVKLVKKKHMYDDKDIEHMMIKHMNGKFRSFPRPREISVGRLNEIADLFGADEALKSRKTSEKLRKLRDRYEELMSDKTLNIRDYDLFVKFINWNYLYIVNGNLPAMSNITKIKIMMRSELPIYSIREEEV